MMLLVMIKASLFNIANSLDKEKDIHAFKPKLLLSFEDVILVAAFSTRRISYRSQTVVVQVYLKLLSLPVSKRA